MFGHNNEADITGNHNVNIQAGGDLSNVTINTIDVDKLITSLNVLQNSATINVLVLTSTNAKIQAKNRLLFSDDSHGNDLSDWKPFDDTNSIKDLLKDYQDKSGFKLNAYFIDLGDDKFESLEISRLKALCENLLILIDGASLLFEGNKHLIKEVFNVPNIGGGLVLVDKRRSADLRLFVVEECKKVLDSLHDYHSHYSDTFLVLQQDSGYFHFDFEVTDKETFYRKITAIAMAHMKIMRNKRVKALDIMGLDSIPTTL
jgi:hypothetical protein